MMILVEDTNPPACQRLQALAERNPRRAVSLARRALDTLQTDDPLVWAWANYTLGWALLCWERFNEAYPYLQNAKDTFETNGVRLAAYRCKHALLLVELWQIDRAGYETDFAELASECIQVGALLDSARAQLEQARQLNVLGRPHDADAVLDHIAPILAQGDPIDRARWLRARGIAANLRNDYNAAADFLTEAEQLAVAQGYKLDVARCWFEQAWVALRQEKLEEALVNYQRAEKVYRRLDLPIRIAFCTKNMALLFTRCGKYDDALQAILTALHYFNAFNRTSDIGGCYLNLGNIYFYTGQWDAAIGCYARAEALCETRGMIGESLIAQRNRAMVYQAQGRRVNALALLAKVEPLVQALDYQLELAEVWRAQAELLAEGGFTNEAIKRYHLARALFAEIPNMLGVADCAMEEGWLALRCGNQENAQVLFQLAAPIITQHPYNQWRIDYGLARCAEARGEVAVALNYYCAACTTVARLRSQLVSEEISSNLYIQASHLHEDALRLAAKYGAAETVLEIGEGQRALVLQHLLSAHTAPLPIAYQDEHAALHAQITMFLDKGYAGEDPTQDRLDAALADYGDLLLRSRHSSPTKPIVPDTLAVVDLATLREHLNGMYSTGWTMLSYILNGNTLLMSVMTPEGVTLEQTSNDEQLQLLIAQATQPAYRRYTYLDLPYLQGQSDQCWADLRTLTDCLLPKSVRLRLHPDHCLLIIPAGPLHALPWAMLRLEEGWLAEHAVVQIAPSLSVWQMLADRPLIRSTDILLIGCSEYGMRAPALPTVDSELATVAAHWPGAHDQLLDALATRAVLLERSEHGRLATYGLLHFAGHACLLPTRGLAAHLKLWDGNLLLPEVAGLRLGDALVVLSACDGAAADALPGEEILSLSWAFLAAGASGVLASLWQVDDSLVMRMIAAFYNELRQHGDAALALALAQRSLIAADQSDADIINGPLGWGSFVLMGIGRILG